MPIVDVATPHGQATAHLHAADEPRAALVLGHGAGGGVNAPDLVAVTEVALSEGFSVGSSSSPTASPDVRLPLPRGNSMPRGPP